MKYLYDFSALRKHISFTFLTQMISCPRSALLGRILKVPAPYKPSKARDQGVLVHEVLERAMKQAKEIKAIPEVLDYERHFKEIRAEHPEKVYELAMPEAELAKALHDYHQDYFGSRATGNIEVEFELPNVEIFGMPAKGRVDIQVDNDVIDYKTKSKATGKKLESSKRLTKLQGAFYNKALSTQGIQMETFQAHNLIIKKKEMVVQPYVFTISELKEAEAELEEMVSNAKEVMDSGIFLRNYNDIYCPCEYYEYCIDDKKTKDFIKSLNIPVNIY